MLVCDNVAGNSTSPDTPNVLTHLESPVREHPQVRWEYLDEASTRWVAIVVQRPGLVPEMRGKAIELVRRIDEDGPVVDKHKGLAFLPPRSVALGVRKGGGMSTDDADILKNKKRFANIFGKREDAVFQTVTRRVLMHDPHSLLLCKRVSMFIKDGRRSSLPARVTGFSEQLTGVACSRNDAHKHTQGPLLRPNHPRHGE